jgi:hypothetical protein
MGLEREDSVAGKESCPGRARNVRAHFAGVTRRAASTGSLSAHSWTTGVSTRMTENPEDEGRGSHRGIHITARSRAGAVAMAIALVALGGIFVVFGLVLLVILAAAGTLLGAGAVAYHRLTGRWPRLFRTREPPARALDPSLEVFSGARHHDRHNDQLPPRAP